MTATDSAQPMTVHSSLRRMIRIFTSLVRFFSRFISRWSQLNLDLIQRLVLLKTPSLSDAETCILCVQRGCMLSLVLFLCCNADNNKKRRLQKSEVMGCLCRWSLLLTLLLHIIHFPFPIDVGSRTNYFIIWINFILHQNHKGKVFLQSLQYIPNFPLLLPTCKNNILQTLALTYPVSSVLYWVREEKDSFLKQKMGA